MNVSSISTISPAPPIGGSLSAFIALRMRWDINQTILYLARHQGRAWRRIERRDEA